MLEFGRLTSMNPYLFVAVTVLSTVASQTLFKIGVRDSSLDEMNEGFWHFLNWAVVAGLFFSILSIVSWLIALSRLQLAVAYPFMSLTFPLIILTSVMLLGEQVSLGRWTGIGLILLGLIIASRN